ncbi:5-formyltetrahydrofolate cyclo-ligase [Campylobacter insulaenigrae]|uniref:5-formyltetrahydrofolate cyclo-ligase n=1 Tax=Campylobacter insulaenigrae TaxID=260714 RepID=UPI0021525C25|nr:5-formyltetrahydrofolate cyclo-ligase [Campylobacter insulaenigrae]MCR6583512.1 5-formyltetrahydrofolate cyclo-ligase [Campylobacter insulaenigrae]
MTKNIFRQIQKNKTNQRIKFQYKKNFIIFKEIIKILKMLKTTKNILIYIPLKHEVDIYRFRHLLSNKYQIFVPFMQDKSLKVVKLRLTLDKKSFGVYEPKNSFLHSRVDIAIVPVIGVDKNFKRIGHGKGFYDRFFANFTHKKPKIIFVQIINGKIKENLCENHDIKGDFYINPYKKYFRKVNKNDRNYSCINSRFYRRRDWICSR